MLAISICEYCQSELKKNRNYLILLILWTWHGWCIKPYDETTREAGSMWLEAITVRTPDLNELENEMAGLIAQLANYSFKFAVSVFRRLPGNSDLSVHLYHRQAPAKPSPEGLFVADALRDFGTVDHAIWLPLDSSPNQTPSINK